MRRLSFLAATLGIATGCYCQTPQFNINPNIEYTTAAVPAYKAIEDIGRIAEKKIRVEDPLSREPVILRLHNAKYKDVLEWLAEALHGTWVDRQDYKVLVRSNHTSLSLRNSLRRARAEIVRAYVLERKYAARKKPLTPDSAKKTILTLYDAKVDRNSAAYRIALENSAEARLFDKAISGIEPFDLAGAPYPNHAVFSNAPRVLQGILKLSAAEMNGLIAEQNLWTDTLKRLSAKYPAMKADASKRLTIPKKSRLLLVLSDPVEGLPSHAVTSMIGPGGNVRVRAESIVTFSRAQNTANNWNAVEYIRVALSPLAVEFANAAKSAGSVAPTDALRTAMMGTSQMDPLQLLISEGLLGVAKSQSWNVVATAPDALVFDPGILAAESSGHLDGAKFLAALERNCQVKVDQAVMIVSHIDPLAAAGKRTNRVAMENYLGTLARTGYSSLNAEAALVEACDNQFDPALVQFYARLLLPTTTPFLDSSIAAIGLVGSLSVDQRKLLNNGMPFRFTDMSERQKRFLASMVLDSPRKIFIHPGALYVQTDRRNPEITNVVDAPTNSGQKLTLTRRQEPVIRVKGVDSYGRPWDSVMTAADVPSFVKNLGRWQSIRFARAKANTTKLTLEVSDVADVAHLLREYPEGFSSFGDASSLPSQTRAALIKGAALPR